MKADSSKNNELTQVITFNDYQVHVASEAIVVVDLVQATATSDLFGWYSVGRGLIRELREMILSVGEKYGLVCMKSTGDGYLLTYANQQAAELAAVNAVEASFELLRLLEERNQTVSEERRINIRLAIHFGQVDILESDREGPNVSFTFRLEGISHVSLETALNAMPPEKFPLQNYIICSEHVFEILTRRLARWKCLSCGLFKLKGFAGWQELYLITLP